MKKIKREKSKSLPDVDIDDMEECISEEFFEAF